MSGIPPVVRTEEYVRDLIEQLGVKLDSSIPLSALPMIEEPVELLQEVEYRFARIRDTRKFVHRENARKFPFPVSVLQWALAHQELPFCEDPRKVLRYFAVATIIGSKSPDMFLFRLALNMHPSGGFEELTIKPVELDTVTHGQDMFLAIPRGWYLPKEGS